MAVLNDYLKVIDFMQTSPVYFQMFRTLDHLKMQNFFTIDWFLSFLLAKYLTEKIPSNWRILPISKMFQWHFGLILFLPVKKLSFSLSKFYCHGRLTGGVKNKKTCQTFCTFSVNGSFIYSVIHKVSSFF